MQITTEILHSDDAQITVLVKQYKYPDIISNVMQTEIVASMVTIDKIIGTTIVHRAGETRRTKSILVTPTPDEIDYEEAAIVATLYFPEE